VTEEFKPNTLSPEAKRWIVRSAVIVFFILVIYIGVCVIYPSAMNKSGERLYREGIGFLEQNNAEDYVGMLKKAVAEYPNTPSGKKAAEDLRTWDSYVTEAAKKKREADKLLKTEEYEKAWAIYAVLMKEYPKSRYGVSAADDFESTALFACDQYSKRIKKERKLFRWASAKDLYERILKILPNYKGAKKGLAEMTAKVSVYLNLLDAGKKAIAEKRYEEARASFEMAREHVPDSIEAYSGRREALVMGPKPNGMALIPPHQLKDVKSVKPAENATPANDDAPKPADTTATEAEATGGGASYYDKYGWYEGSYIDDHEVTNAEYAAFVAATGHRAPAHWRGIAPPESIRSLPVVCVSRADAAAYAKHVGKRLPTMWEWLKAGRGLDSTLAYPWGPDFAMDKAVLSGQARRAGSVSADRSPVGVMDMVGNVSEWVADPVVNGEGFGWVYGNSFAGLELMRPDRMVPDDIANEQTPPENAMLIDHPKYWGMKVRARSELFWFVHGKGLKDDPYFQVRKYMPEIEAYAVKSFRVKKNSPIAVTVLMRIPMPGGDKRKVERKVDTGYTLVSSTPVPQSTDLIVVVQGPDGKRKTLRRERHEKMPEAAGRLDPEFAPDYNALVADLRASSLKQPTMLTHCRTAPVAGRFFNVGFRCIRDIGPAKRPE
jgi:tetratricopeptide (TPR) repeat protein